MGLFCTRLSGIVASLIFCLGVLCVTMVSAAAVAETTSWPEPLPQTLHDTAKKLGVGSFRKTAEQIAELAASQDPRVAPILRALMAGDLYSERGSKDIGIAHESGYYSLLDGQVKEAGQWKKIKVNNGLRRDIRTHLAALDIASPVNKVRREAALNLVKNPDSALRSLVFDAHTKETIAEVKEAMSLALAAIDIQSPDTETRLSAINRLSLSVEPASVVILEAVVAEPSLDADVLKAAEKALQQAKGKIQFYKAIETIFFGLSLGSVLLLAAIGLAITFGVMGVINMAHGEMIMLGAYTTYALQALFPSLIEASVLLAIPAAFLVSGLVGIAIERCVIRHLYGRPLETLLATFGVSLFLQQLVRTFRANNVAVVTPDWMSGMWQINGALSLTYNRLFIILFSLLVLGVLALLLKKTLLGLQMRAVTQNRPMANSMGIRSARVDALTFGLGSGIAGMAGVALSQITNVGPNMGQQYIIDSFMVVVFGGVGNLLGTFFAAMSLGLVNKLLEPFAGAVLGKIIVLIFIILFIQWRPRGLFALKGRFVED